MSPPLKADSAAALASISAPLDPSNGRVETHFSTHTEDSKWDEFLQASPSGQFQQSSAWARYKQSGGWTPVRAVFKRDDSIVGGFQLLWKHTKRGRIGYVSKGPVLDGRIDDSVGSTTDLLQRTAVKLGLRALIAQPPDDCPPQLPEELQTRGFLPCDSLGIIDSTLLIDLGGRDSHVVGGFRRSTRSKYRKAIRGGMSIHEGNKWDVPDFFRLMRASCDRQRVSPNPPDQEALTELWASMASRNMVRLTFAVLDGELVSGELFICFGNRISIFKTGWTGRYREIHPNNFVICEALEWARLNHFKIADFVGLDRDLADTVLEGKKISQAQNQSRDAFKLGFGGVPRLLPSAGLWIPNPVLRQCYRLATSMPFVKKRLKLNIR